MAALTFIKSLHLWFLFPAPASIAGEPQSNLPPMISWRSHGAALRCPQHFFHRKIDMTTNQTGTVKWFNEGKGYGFIAPDDGGKDLFAHFREIQTGSGYKTLAENARVQFDVTQGAKGPQASNIRTIA